jgi:hypothetical protein
MEYGEGHRRDNEGAGPGVRQSPSGVGSGRLDVALYSVVWAGNPNLDLGDMAVLHISAPRQ